MTELFDKQAAAKTLGVSIRTLDYLRAKGELRWVQLGPRAVRFTADQIQDFVSGRERGGKTVGA